MTTKLICLSPQMLSRVTGIDNRHTSSEVDNSSLVKMIKLKNEKGFQVLYQKYSGALYSAILRFGIRPEAGEDLLQDTFVNIWKNIENYDTLKGTLFTWMLRIARNKAIDYLRSASYQQQLQCENIDLLSLNNGYNHLKFSAGNEVESTEFKKNTLVHLNEKSAEVIEMIYFYGWTHQQTSDILNFPLGTVKTRARKGLNALKILYKY